MVSPNLCSPLRVGPSLILFILGTSALLLLLSAGSWVSLERERTRVSLSRSVDFIESFLSQFPEQSYHLSTAVKILPLSLIFVGMISFNNLCLQYLFLSPSLFLEMFKFHSILLLVLWLFFSTLFSRIFFSFFPLLAPSFVLLHTTTSFPVILTLCIVVFGFIIGSKGEIDFSITGTVFGVCSSIFVSLNSIYTKKLMHIVDNNSWILCFYVWFFPFTRFYRITWTLASCLCLWLFTLKRTPFFNTFLFWVLLLSGVGWPWLAFLASWLVLLPFCRYCFIPLGRIDS